MATQDAPHLPTPPRSPRLVARFLLAAVALLGLTAALTIHLTTRALERRVGEEMLHTARLVGGAGFPLTDPALRRVADYIQAEVVALDREGRVLASSDPALAAAAPGLVAAGPPDLRGPRVIRGEVWAGHAVTLGVAPLPRRGGAVYVIYPADLISAQAREAWLPLLGVALLAALLAAGLGVVSEQRVQRERNAALTRLLASVAHEVRNPLGAIRTLARSLQAQAAPEARQPLELIASEADRLTLLADGLRAVGLPVRTLHRACDADGEVRAVTQLLSHQLEHRQVEVELALAGARPVEADPAQVRQVVLNLVLNAADAMPEGGRVRLVSREHEGAWELEVEDEGPGVAPELAPRLFEAFQSSKPRGLGVGLYLSRRLVAANGGALSLEPQRPGRGARFRVRWPLATPDVAEPAAPPAETPADPAAEAAPAEAAPTPTKA
ncbi:MAG: sensor histidine kinase [Planctomycetota bacterium]